MDHDRYSSECCADSEAKLTPQQIRCIYRVIEFAQGYDGYLRTTEWCFYVLDTLPLLAAIIVWLIVWPTSILIRTPAAAMPLHVRNNQSSKI